MISSLPHVDRSIVEAAEEMLYYGIDSIVLAAEEMLYYVIDLGKVCALNLMLEKANV